MAHHKEKYNQNFVNRVHEMKAVKFTNEEISKELNIKAPAVAYILKNRSYVKTSPMDVVLEVFHEEEAKESMLTKIKRLLKFW
tara:strand:+ start:358 stop:606 length:249 start_codon:yes stop_codon:yes gene_type:complete